MGIAHPASVLGVFQARILDYIVISFSRDSTPPRDRTRVSCVSRQSLPLSHQGSLYKELAWNNKFSSVPSLNRVWLFAIPWTAACQASLSITNFRSLRKLMSIKSLMPSSHLILCCHPLLLPSVFPSIRVFSSESVLHIKWPNYWSFSFSISPVSEYSGLISFRMDWLDLLAVQGTLKSLLQHHSSKKHQFFSVQLSL